MAIICKECGVELEDTMAVCPLCDTAVNSGSAEKININEKTGLNKQDEANTRRHKNNYHLNQVLWQVMAISLLSGIAATLIINLAIQGTITWSVYPISVCLIVLIYASVFSLCRTRTILKLVGGWILSAAGLFILSAIIDKSWPVKLALPLLCAVNIVVLLLIVVLKVLRKKGLNIFAICLVAIALLCLSVEAIISFYFQNTVKLEWSAIVAACLLPVTIAVLFMYFRTRNSAEWKKIFHT